uniref:hypothetical protein n=1 Tax=uncultured Acidovorax sp. TaxID=158751 RepID=UPI0025E5C6E6|nr:hypothetical protein [uncultured Acidovorax sp.]
MASIQLEKKIAKLKAFAYQETPKARSCSEVIYAAIQDDIGQIDAAVLELKKCCGANWSLITALQFMSGRRGEFSALAAPSDEIERLMVAHLVAKEVCSNAGLGAVDAVGVSDIEKLRACIRASYSAKVGR